MTYSQDLTSRHAQYLRAMGIPIWVRRESALFLLPVAETQVPMEHDGEEGPVHAIAGNPLPTADSDTFNIPPHSAVLEEEFPAIDSQTACPPTAKPTVPLPTQPMPMTVSSSSSSSPLLSTNFTLSPADAALAWQDLQQRVAHCTACELCQGRTQTVFGTGNINANYLFVGEGPGEEEDAQGLPFVGPAGRLLNAMLYAINLQREQVYIANVVKCRPPQNRNPKEEEMKQCAPFLQQQIQLIQPKLIIALGAVAAQHLLAKNTPIGQLRQQQLYYQNIPLIATYHPAYLLRRPSEKRRSWQDLQFIHSTFQQLP